MNIELVASDGHRLKAWLAQPSVTPRGAVVVVQEIFGVNGHIREVADGYARDGWLALAPSLFDRVERGIELGYGPGDIEQGRTIRNACGDELPLLDIAAAIDRIKGAGKVGVIGYCWGGLLTWLAACKLPGLSAAVPYYGGGIPAHADLTPRCPVLAHFGRQDQHIPVDSVQAWHAKHPEVELRFYDAGHGFNCDQRASYDSASATLARERTLSFLLRHLS